MGYLGAVADSFHQLPLVLKVMGLCIVAGLVLMAGGPRWGRYR